MKVTAYYRVSTTEQSKNRNGLEAQKREIHEWASNNGYEIIAEFEEVISGASEYDNRPVLKKAIQYAAKQNSTLAVNRLDRLSRRVSFISALMETKCKFVAVNLGEDVDPFVLQIFSCIAEKERVDIAYRTKAALQSVKLKGKALGFDNPAIALHQERALEESKKAVKEAADRFASKMKTMVNMMLENGMSLKAIAEALNEQSIPTARNGKWTATAVSRVVKRIKGE